MAGTIEKVTVFITHPVGDTHELLLFEHPAAGIQIPAGTVEVDESPEAAALREAAEETGLAGFTSLQYVGCTDDVLAGQRVVSAPTRVYSRPDTASLDLARLSRGLTVELEREVEGFAQVTYQEFDRLPDPQYVTYRITGWVPDASLADRRKRHFFHVTYAGTSAERWVVAVDGHRFTLFWAPVAALPPIIHPQDRWIAMLPGRLRSGSANQHRRAERDMSDRSRSEVVLPAGTALVVIDVQKGLDEPYWGERNNPEAEQNIARLLDAWRRRGWTIYHVQHQSKNPNSPLRPNYVGNEIKDIVGPLPGEPVLQKRENSAFIGTDLEARLRAGNHGAVALTGLTTDHCVSTTARMAANLGFDTIVVSDATATFDRTSPITSRRFTAEEIHEAELTSLNGEFARIVETDALIRALGSEVS